MGRGDNRADSLFYGSELSSVGASAVSDIDASQDAESFHLVQRIFERLKSSGDQEDVLPSKETPFFLSVLSDISASGEYLAVCLRVSDTEKPQMSLCVYKEAEDDFEFDSYYETLLDSNSLHEIVMAGKQWGRQNRCVVDGNRQSAHDDIQAIVEGPFF